MKTKTERKSMYSLRNCMLSKTTILIVLLALLMSGTNNNLVAQNRIGVKIIAGGSCQSEALHIADNSNLKFAYGIGISDHLQLTETFALQTGLEFIQKGKKEDLIPNDVTTKLNYLLVPLTGEFSFGEKIGFNKGQRFYVATGPYFAYLLSSKTTAGTTTDKPRDYDLGLRLSTGLEFPVFAADKIRIGLNYDMGLTDVYKTTNIQNKMCSVSFGYQF